MKLFQKSPEEIRIAAKLDKIENAKQHEMHRAPNPCKTVFPDEDFIPFQVQQDGKNIKLMTYRYPQVGDLKGIVFVFHGLCAHINHGAHIAESLAQAGLLVVGFDHRGFGKSEGLRGYLEDLGLHLQDSRAFIKMILNLYNDPKVPIFLTGLSMGGMTSFRLACEKVVPIRGVILFAPAIKPFQSDFMISVVKTLGKLAPKKQWIPPKRGIATKNPGISEEMFADPLTYSDEMRPGTAATILSAMQESEKMYEQLSCPWLIIQGGVDKLVDPDVAVELYKRSPSPDKEILFYEDCWYLITSKHDIWHEQEILDAIPKVVNWVVKRI